MGSVGRAITTRVSIIWSIRDLGSNSGMKTAGVEKDHGSSYGINSGIDALKMFEDLSGNTSVTIHRTGNTNTCNFSENNGMSGEGKTIGKGMSGSYASLEAVEEGITVASTTDKIPSSTPSICVRAGRIQFRNALQQLETNGTVGVILCGPSSFTADAKAAADDYAAGRKERVFVSVESFEL